MVASSLIVSASLELHGAVPPDMVMKHFDMLEDGW